MKRQMKKLLAVCLLCILLAAFAGVGLTYYYKDTFAPNTWINGIYCTGKTVEEVNEQLLETTDFPEIVQLTGYEPGTLERKTKIWEIRSGDISLAADYTDNLSECLRSQHRSYWTGGFFMRTERSLQPGFSYDVEKLDEKWSDIAAFARSSVEYRIQYAPETGYSLYDNRSSRLDEEKAYQLLQEALTAGSERIDFAEAECYCEIPLDKQQEKVSALWEQIKRFQTGGPVYDWGDGGEQLPQAVMAAFLQKEEQAPFLPLMDENGCFQIAEDTVDSYVEELADRHDTQGKEWKFQSTRGKIVTVPGNTYGATIDRAVEKKWLQAYLRDLGDGKMEGNARISHIPKYTKESYCRSSSSLGNTYIEVDMGTQRLYCYKDGKLALETDIVTGDMRRDRSTPEGVNYIYLKERNCVLRGPGYASWVAYWMPVYKGIGIHDANWRNQFGGEIYQTNGSHGCINVPPNVMGELYELAEVGMPVVMFYGNDE